MRVLFVMDPLSKLDIRWDTSLCLLGELARRGHENYLTDASDLKMKGRQLLGRVSKIYPKKNGPYSLVSDFRVSRSAQENLKPFDLILIRKNPPVDRTYLRMTKLLSKIAEEVPIVNHPRGIQKTNEKLIVLKFPRWAPESLASKSAAAIFHFQKKLADDIILKPLDNKGGYGILWIKHRDPYAFAKIKKATSSGRKVLMAQRYIRSPSGRQTDKRLLILDGKFLAAFERRAARGEFRTNLGLGGTFYATWLSRRERELIRDLRPYLLNEGLRFVGIDVMNEKLIELNVTSPAGLIEAKILDPRSEPAQAWADSLEALVRSF